MQIPDQKPLIIASTRGVGETSITTTAFVWTEALFDGTFLVMSDPTPDTSGAATLEGLGEGGTGARLEPHAQALLFLLRIYTLNHRSARIDKIEFNGFVKQYAGRYLLKYPQMEDFIQRTEGMVDTYLRMLVERGLCTLEKEGQEDRWIFFAHYYIEVLHKAYRDLEAKPGKPFPSEEELRITIPEHLVSEIDIKKDFVSALGEMKTEKPQVLRLIFPELIKPILITSDQVEKKLMEASVQKLRIYLESRNNASYVMHRLHPALRGNERGLRDMVTAVMTKPGRAIATLLDPSDFSFRFWAHFANHVLQEHKEVSEKTAEEQSYCQAAYLIGFYNVHYRGKQQRQNEKSTLLKKFDTQFRKYPYAYTLKDLYSVRDEKGFPLIRKNTRDVFLEFLENKTKSEGYQTLPELVHLKTVHNKDYYIHRDLIIPLFVKMVNEQAREIKDGYIEEWVKLIKENKRILAMSEDQEFVRDLDITLKNQAPFLYSLLNYNLLYLTKEQGKISYDMARTMDRILDQKQGQLHPLPKILGFTRKDILDDAKLRVPIWRRLTIFRGLFFFFQNLFRNIGKALSRSRERALEKKAGLEGEKLRAGETISARGAAATPATEKVEVAGSTTMRPISTKQLAAYRKAVQELKLHFVGSEKTLPETLKELMEKWNPLYDPQARTNLVEDVNSMIRDYLRNIKRTFRISPPDAARIRSLAEKLGANKSFARIKRKDYFIRYIEIYMIKLLGER